MAEKINALSTTQQKGLTSQKPKFSVFMKQEHIQNLVQQAVGKNAQRFTASIISAVSNNPALSECDQGSILSAAILGESLNLSPSPQLGQYYMVPYKDKNRGTVAQFQLGYKGYIQLAIRTGQYKKLNVLAIKKGELIRHDPLSEDLYVQLIQDEEEREKAETVGYYAMFEYVNGFRKAIYWSKSKMLKHADTYSQAFSKDGEKVKTKFGTKEKVSYADYLAGNYDPNDAWLYSSFWYKNFDDMAFKTMLRHLISRWGIMSVEMQTAFLSDNAIINESGEPSYVETGYEDGPIEEPDLGNPEDEVTQAEKDDFDFFAQNNA